MFITKKEHLRIVADKDERIEKLSEAIKEERRRNDISELLRKHDQDLCGITGYVDSLRAGFPDNIPQYVDDYFGGKLFKQEATKVVILDKDGNATYALTAKTPDEGFSYVLDRK